MGTILPLVSPDWVIPHQPRPVSVLKSATDAPPQDGTLDRIASREGRCSRMVRQLTELTDGGLALPIENLAQADDAGPYRQLNAVSALATVDLKWFRIGAQ
jgi:hypothetical protein